MAEHVTIAELNCQEFASFCSNLKMTGTPGISGYPTLRMFAIAQADDKRFNVDYTGQREAKPMADFAELHANSFVYSIQPAYTEKEKSRNKRLVTLDEFLSKVLLSYICMAFDGFRGLHCPRLFCSGRKSLRFRCP